MAQQYIIRKATNSDIERMSEIENSAAELFSVLPSEFLQKLPEDIPPRSDSFYHSMISLESSWVICAGEEIAGFICTGKVPEQNCLHIYELAVARSFQRKGLGGNLLRFVIAWASKERIAKLTLTTFIDVPWNAPFYCALGFAIINDGALDERLQRILQDEVAMGLPGETRCAMELHIK